MVTLDNKLGGLLGFDPCGLSCNDDPDEELIRRTLEAIHSTDTAMIIFESEVPLPVMNYMSPSKMFPMCPSFDLLAL